MFYPRVDFSAARHDGGEVQHTVEWYASCTCWKSVGSSFYRCGCGKRPPVVIVS